MMLAAGVILLFGGGELLIRGALSVSEKLGVSALVSGIVIVGFGTSTPELVVSVDAALHEMPDLAVGNVLGSNISNMLLILGLCALIIPMKVKKIVLSRDAVSAALFSVVFIVMSSNGFISQIEGIILLLLLAGWLGIALFTERGNSGPAADMHKAEAKLLKKPDGWFVALCCTGAGLAVLLSGSRFLINGASGLAVFLEVPEPIIGLTVVAVGTSLPELSVSLIAALRGQADVAVGNILGSNIFNIAAILGISALIQPLQISPAFISFDQWVMAGVSVVLLLFLYTGRVVSRVEAAILLSGYLLYLWMLFRMM